VRMRSVLRFIAAPLGVRAARRRIGMGR
jgi:hypothetical protein